MGHGCRRAHDRVLQGAGIQKWLERSVGGVWRRWCRHGGRRDMRQTACTGSRGVVKHTACTTAKQRTKSI